MPARVAAAHANYWAIAKEAPGLWLRWNPKPTRKTHDGADLITDEIAEPTGLGEAKTTHLPSAPKTAWVVP